MKFDLKENDINRFWGKVNKVGPMLQKMTTPCWIWTGTTAGEGYGHFRIGRKIHKAHRVAFGIANNIPFGMCVCHRCDNPPCVNPDHLFLGSKLDNARDRESKGRGVYPSGDEWMAHHFASLPRGEKHWKAKLSAITVMEIRNRYRTGGVSHSALASEYNVSQANIQRILCGKGWSHLNKEEPCLK